MILFWAKLLKTNKALQLSSGNKARATRESQMVSFNFHKTYCQSTHHIQRQSKPAFSVTQNQVRTILGRTKTGPAVTHCLRATSSRAILGSRLKLVLRLVKKQLRECISGEHTSQQVMRTGQVHSPGDVLLAGQVDTYAEAAVLTSAANWIVQFAILSVASWG